MTARNHTRHYLVRVVPYRTVEGIGGGIILVFLDITGSVLAEEHRHSVASDVNKILKSTMDVVLAMAEQPSARAASDPALVELFVSRLAALSFTHELLSQSDWASLALDKLIEAELGAQIATSRERIRIDGPALPLVPHAALTLGVVFHELVHDASKYGALSIPGGRVEVRWNLQGPTDATQVVIVWAEAGGPQRGTDPGRASGFAMIQHTIAVELSGTAEIQFGECGMRCAIAIPANDSTFTSPAPPSPKEGFGRLPSA